MLVVYSISKARRFFVIMLNPEEGDEYQARLRLTETNTGFGNKGSVGESYRGNNPSQVRNRE